MTPVRLTPAAARELEPGKILRDHEITGLELHARAGSKSWKLYYRTRAGTERRPTLGRFPEMSLSAARNLAKDLKERIARGEDPSADWKAQRAAATVAELCDRYLEEWAPRHKSERAVYDDRLRINRYVLPGLGDKKVAEVTRADIDKFLENVRDRKYVKHLQTGERWREQRQSPGQALQVRRLLSKMWNLAQNDFEMDPRDKNPVSAAISFRTPGRERFPDPHEMARLIAALQRLEATRPVHATCLWTIFLTGARVSEILHAEWRELRGNRLIKEKHKTVAHIGKKQIALPVEAMRLIDALPRTSKRIFPGIALRKTWEALREEAGCSDIELRDARRTFLSYGLSLGETMDTLAKQAGHTQPGVTAKHYAFLLEDDKDRVANKVAERMLSTSRR